MTCSCENCECKRENTEEDVTYYRIWPSRGDLLFTGGALILFAIPILYTLLT